MEECEQWSFSLWHCLQSTVTWSLLSETPIFSSGPRSPTPSDCVLYITWWINFWKHVRLYTAYLILVFLVNETKNILHRLIAGLSRIQTVLDFFILAIFIRYILFYREVHRVLVGKPEGKRPLGRPRRRWEDNIKIDLQEVGRGRGDWMKLSQDRDSWRALVGTVRNFRVP